VRKAKLQPNIYFKTLTHAVKNAYSTHFWVNSTRQLNVLQALSCQQSWIPWLQVKPTATIQICMYSP